MNKVKLLILMKEWLSISQDDDVTILQILGIVNSYEKWRVEKFYFHFTPLMAEYIDGIREGDL